MVPVVIDHPQAVGQIVDDRAAEKPSTVRTHAILSETAAHEVQRFEEVARSGVVESRSDARLLDEHLGPEELRIGVVGHLVSITRGIRRARACGGVA